jgi:hypothetical protein
VRNLSGSGAFRTLRRRLICTEARWRARKRPLRRPGCASLRREGHGVLVHRQYLAPGFGGRGVNRNCFFGRGCSTWQSGALGASNKATLGGNCLSRFRHGFVSQCNQ